MKKKDAKGDMNATPRKFEGSIVWCEIAKAEEVRIERAILRSLDELVIECDFHGCRYTVKLRRAKGEYFSGKFETAQGGNMSQGEVSCQLFLSGGTGFIFGTWREEGTSYYWWAELDEVDQFADEINSTND